MLDDGFVVAIDDIDDKLLQNGIVVIGGALLIVQIVWLLTAIDKYIILWQ